MATGSCPGCHFYEGRNKFLKRWISIFTAFLLLFPLAGCADTMELPKAERAFLAMNTYMTFTAYGEQAEAALEASEQLIQKIESLWSVTDEGSEIYRANHSGGQSISVSEETAELIVFALEMAQKTGGALEPTLYPVLTAWGFTTDSKQIPSQEQITELLQNVDYSRIRLEQAILTVPNGMQLDLGAVGKGYAADLAMEVLKEHGIESAILSLGGNIQAIGSRPDGSDWRLGIRAPWEDGNLGVLEISDAAVVTSGGYENYFEDQAGNVYWHILDPSTGCPADSGLQSVTIIGKEGKLCDALSTALFVMGAEKAEAYWRENSNFDMLMVTDQHEIILTEGIADRFSLRDGRTETIRVLKK